MGSAAVQGELWGAAARDWADVQEALTRPLYETVFDRVGLRPGTHLLDAGCGAGLAAQLAAARGAAVAGIDASAALLEIARSRVPTGDFRVGELEELPYSEGTFDVVTGFNSFQYAENPTAALRGRTRDEEGRAGGHGDLGTCSGLRARRYPGCRGCLSPAPSPRRRGAVRPLGARPHRVFDGASRASPGR